MPSQTLTRPQIARKLFEPHPDFADWFEEKPDKARDAIKGKIGKIRMAYNEARTRIRNMTGNGPYLTIQADEEVDLEIVTDEKRTEFREPLAVSLCSF